MRIKGLIFDFNRTLYNPKNQELISGALPVIDYFSKKYQLCLVSRESPERRDQISKSGIELYFSHVEIVSTKDQSCFQRCLDSMQVDASQAVVIGDRAQVEIDLGQRMGMITIWYRNDKFKRQPPLRPANHTIYNLEDLFKIL